MIPPRVFNLTGEIVRELVRDGCPPNEAVSVEVRLLQVLSQLEYSKPPTKGGAHDGFSKPPATLPARGD